MLPEKVKANGAAPKLKSRAPKKRGGHVPVGTFLIEKGGVGSFREMKSDMPRIVGGVFQWVKIALFECFVTLYIVEKKITCLNKMTQHRIEPARKCVAY